MKKIYDSKLFWVIVSCVLSFVLWVYVTSVQSDEVRQTFRGVRVEMIGENVLRDYRPQHQYCQCGADRTT